MVETAWGDAAPRPRALLPGDTVAVVAPASPVRFPERLRAGLALLADWGLRSRVMPHVHDVHGFLAGTDEDRLADLHAAWADPAVRAVWCARGGYGCSRLSERLDGGVLRADPKLLVGFSDATALHLAFARLGLVSLHGPTGEWNPSRTAGPSAAALRRALTDPAPLGALACPPLQTLVPGRAEGELVGGNLSLLAAAVGTSDEPDTAGRLLLLEDVGEPPYRVDRLLRQLSRAGIVERAAGLVFGAFARCEERHRPSFTVEEVIAAFAADAGLPAVAGAPLGHGPGQLTVPLGVRASLDADAGTLAFLEAATTP